MPEDGYNRCDWSMPDDAKALPGHRCVREADHPDDHVVGSAMGDSITLWRVNVEQRTLKMEVHADGRNGVQMDDDDCVALWVSMVVMRLASSTRQCDG